MKTNQIKILSALCLGTSLICAGLTTGCATSDQSTASAAESSQDAATAQNIKQALDNQGGQKFAFVNVRVRDGVAKLSGKVDSRDDKSQAAAIASTVGNVRETVNHISVPSDIHLDANPYTPDIPSYGASE